MIQFERKILYSYLKVLSITLICFALLVINGLFSEAEMRGTNQAVFHNSVSLWNIFMHNSLLFILSLVISPLTKGFGGAFIIFLSLMGLFFKLNAITVFAAHSYLTTVVITIPHSFFELAVMVIPISFAKAVRDNSVTSQIKWMKVFLIVLIFGELILLVAAFVETKIALPEMMRVFNE